MEGKKKKGASLPRLARWKCAHRQQASIGLFLRETPSGWKLVCDDILSLVGGKLVALTDNQNSEGSLRLLAAQRHTYARAKVLHQLRLAVAIVLALASPIVLFVAPGTKVFIGLLAMVATAVCCLFPIFWEQSLTKQAARMQEQFDTELFGMPWNDVKAGQRVRPEVINAASVDFRGDRGALRDWYRDTGDLPQLMAILLCQRANLVWDSRLRRHFALRVGLFLAAWFVLGVAIGLFKPLTLSDYLLALFAPSLPAFIEGAKLVWDHVRVANEKDVLEATLVQSWTEALTVAANLDMAKCRQIQDCIYDLRCTSLYVPEWWYWRLRDRYEADMRETVEHYKQQAEAQIGVGHHGEQP